MILLKEYVTEFSGGRCVPEKYLLHIIYRKQIRKWQKLNEKKQKLILDGNAFYEIDLECLKQKKEKEHREKQRAEHQKRQRK